MSGLKRPSPALVISIMALVAALVVPAYAALTKKDKKTVKNIANTEITKRAPGLAVASAQSASMANSASTAGNADLLDGQDSSDLASMWAVVTSTGILVRAGQNGTSATRNSAGNYFVTFPRNVSGCAYKVQIVDDLNLLGLGDPANPAGQPAVVHVGTYVPDGSSQVDRGFHLWVAC